MYYIFSYSDTIFPFLTLVVFLLVWKKIDGRENLLLAFILINFFLFGISNILSAYYVNNLFLYHFYTLIELWLIGYYILVRLMEKKETWLKICFGYTALWIIDIFMFEPLTSFPSYSGGLSNLLLIIIAMVYLLRLAKSDNILYFQKIPSFWFVSAFLVSCSFMILGYVMYNFYVVNKLPALGKQIAALLYISTILKFTFIIIGLICYRRPRTQLFLL